MSYAGIDEALAIQDAVNEKMAEMVHGAVTKLTDQGVDLHEIDTRTYDYDPGCTYLTVKGVHVFRVCAIFFEDRITVACSWVPEGVGALEPDESPELDALAN